MKCHCGKHFEPVKPNQKHCSNACKQRWHRQQKAQNSRNETAETGIETLRDGISREEFEELRNMLRQILQSVDAKGSAPVLQYKRLPNLVSSGKSGNPGFICRKRDFEHTYMDYQDAVAVSGHRTGV